MGGGGINGLVQGGRMALSRALSHDSLSTWTSPRRPWRPLRLGLAGDGLSDRGLRNAKPSRVTPGAQAQGAGLGHRWCLRTSLQASVPSKQWVPRGLCFCAFCFNSSFLRLISS